MNVHPARMKWIVKRLTLVVTSLAMLLLMMAAVQYRNKSVVAEDGLSIQIVNNPLQNKFIVEKNVIQILFKEFRHAIVGQPLELIDIQEIEAVLEEDMFIQDADVYIDAFNKVHISIEQRVPIARIMDEEASSFYLDGKGKRVRTSADFTARVLVVTGKIGQFNPNYRSIEQNRLNQIFQLVKYIDKHPFWKAQFEQIHIDSEGEVQLIPKLGDQIIYFGQSNQNIVDKFKRLSVFDKGGLAYEGWNKYKSINLAYAGQVVAKKR